MDKLCQDRVCVVTGAGRGIGREHALMLAAHGACVIVNDVGAAVDGAGSDAGPARQVVDEIMAAGGRAASNTDDVSSWEGAGRLVQQAIDTFGRIDVVVNNAGILRDRMLVNMSEDDWDSVIRVHLKGTFATTRFAAVHWRDRAKRGETTDARVINTTSVSGLYGNPGQSNYGAAKAGVAAFTRIAALELARYGVTVNALAPGALTRMTDGLPIDEETRRALEPRWVAPASTWLASSRSGGITGHVIEVTGQLIGVAESWRRGPTAAPVDDPELVGEIVERLVAEAKPGTTMGDL